MDHSQLFQPLSRKRSFISKMKWTKGVRCLTNQYKCNTSSFRKCQNLALIAERDSFASLQADRGYVATPSFTHAGCGSEGIYETMGSTRNLAWNVKLPCCLSGNTLARKRCAMVISCQYSHSVKDGPEFSRDFFVQLWAEHKKKRSSEEKISQKFLKYAHLGVTDYGIRTRSQVRYQRRSSEASVTDARSYDESNQVQKQPPTSQSIRGPLEPSSVEEAQIAPLLARSNLLVTRDIEWANLVAGFEQENRYQVVDVCYPQSPVGYIREQSNIIARQLLRTRRPFVAYIFDGLGNELFRVRRPFWWITSTIYAEINGKEIGVVHRRWHLWRRIYDLYLGNRQFAVVENPGLWNWTFTLKDIDGSVLAQIDRNWRGFGFELFTDAGQYVIQFGTADSSSVPLTGIQELQVKRPLTLAERAVAVALAVSLDNDYFSRHGGWHIPLIDIGE